MARYAFEDPLAGAQPRSGGGWKQLFWFAVAFAGLGFAGYVYLIPYQKMQHAVGTRQAELASERAAAEEATAERDKLKTTLEKYTSSDKDRAAAEAKQKTTSDALELALKTGLGELGAAVTADGTKLRVSFPVGKVIDANGMDVSEAGQAAMKSWPAPPRRRTPRCGWSPAPRRRRHPRSSAASFTPPVKCAPCAPPA